MDAKQTTIGGMIILLKDAQVRADLAALTGATGAVGVLQQKVAALEAMIESDSDEVINKWQEIIAFLDGLKPGEASKLQKLLEAKANATHTHTKADITDFDHDHDGRYYTKTDVDTLLSNYYKKTETYSKTEVDSKLAGKSDTAHTHKFSDLQEKPTALSGYGITDAYTKAQTDAAVKAEADRAKGVEATLAAQISTLQRGVAGGVGFTLSMDDTAKVLSFIGTETQLAAFDYWIEHSARPCEVKKDGSDFAYLTATEGTAMSENFKTRADGSASHYDTADKADYLQMAELENVNLSFFADNVLRTITVMFNFDESCPAGYHRWFGGSTKLFARYDWSKNAADSTKGDVMKGGKWTGSNSVTAMHAMNKATGENILEVTGWELAVIGWLQAMYCRSLDVQAKLGRGIESGSQSAAEAYVNGLTDSLTKSVGKVSTTGGEAIRFMHMENPNYGLRWIWGAGVRGELTVGYFTYDAAKANKAALMDIADADETFTITAANNTYPKNVNKLGVLTEAGGSSSTGFPDGQWSNITATQRIEYVGGYSYDGSLGGPFARTLYAGVSYSAWHLRGRCAMNR